ncbi:radical SAM protein [Streptomyces nigrescens]|uniref:radical SAM protein n=1 Tax=Streptomyces nigrescens TaxID=1920 RepID=UPI00348FA00E
MQFIGGEPTMHLHFAELVDHALNVGLHVEVYSNLVHVSAECWEVFQRDGLSLATSYYSDQAEQHNAVTGRPSHARTRVNIERAVGLGIPLRVGIIDGGNGQRVDEAREDLKGTSGSLSASRSLRGDRRTSRPNLATFPMLSASSNKSGNCPSPARPTNGRRRVGTVSQTRLMPNCSGARRCCSLTSTRTT